jgi:hypothetical protein
MVKRLLCAVAAAMLTANFSALAQEPSRAAKDLDWTRQMIAQYHWVALVNVEMAPQQLTKFEYDYYPKDKNGPEVTRIKDADGTFARVAGKAWLRSDDWGATGQPVTDGKAGQLDTYAQITMVPLGKPAPHDPSQGAIVWKRISQGQSKDFTYFTFERTRERPLPGGVYPRFTFMKSSTDKDGQLFLSSFSGPLSVNNQPVPLAISYTYMVPVAGPK